MAANRTSDAAAETAGNARREITLFLLLAIVVLPIVMLGAIAAYGFIVWFMQIWFWGPPT
ncbi:MAG: nitrate reductase [Roseovarius sp.]|nr:nitrate reductase [Roseovarius sp.]